MAGRALANTSIGDWSRAAVSPGHLVRATMQKLFVLAKVDSFLAL